MIIGGCWMSKIMIVVDSRVSVWRRDYVEVEAANEREAAQAYIDGTAYYEFIDGEYLYDSKVIEDPTDSEATVEIFDERIENLLFSNKGGRTEVV